MKKVLITGSSGFIGRMMCKKFLEQHFEVTGWDYIQSGNTSFESRIVDMMDYMAVKKQMAIDCPDIVIHCAGSADVAKSVKNPLSDYNGNVTLTHNFLFAIHELGFEDTKFLFISSASVYGNPTKLPIEENAPLNPLSPYALHKVMCEDICFYFVRNYQMDIKIARIFSAYGRGLKKQIFWDMYHKAEINKKLELFGTGKESRDYIHINDVAQALFLIATSSSKDILFNVANGEEITIQKVAEIFAKSYGIDDIYFIGTTREGDPLNWRADITRLKSIGYKQTELIEHGISDYIYWVRTQKSGI